MVKLVAKVQFYGRILKLFLSWLTFKSGMVFAMWEEGIFIVFLALFIIALPVC